MKWVVESSDPWGLNPESLRFLLTDFHNNHQTRCEILVQWIQGAIVQGHNDQTISIPAPILSRTFQELSRGIVNIQNARKINDLPYPFHCAQLLTVPRTDCFFWEKSFDETRRVFFCLLLKDIDDRDIRSHTNDACNCKTTVTIKPSPFSLGIFHQRWSPILFVFFVRRWCSLCIPWAFRWDQPMYLSSGYLRLWWPCWTSSVCGVWIMVLWRWNIPFVQGIMDYLFIEKCVTWMNVCWFWC